MDDFEKNRNAVKAKLQNYYIPEDFQAKLDSALSEFNTEENQFSMPTDPKQWEVHTSMKCLYNWGGWYVFEEKERILTIEVKGRICVNDEPCGPVQTIKYSATSGFENLDAHVKLAAMHLDDKAPDEQFLHDDGIDFSIGSIMNKTYATEGEKERTDGLIELITKALTDMGCSKKRSYTLAIDVLSKNPQLRDLDKLMDKVMQEL